LIPKIKIDPIGVTPVNTYVINVPIVNPPNVPISVPIGFPVIEMPCVKARRSIENDGLIDNDPDGNMILCPAQTPSYEPMNFEPMRFVPIKDEEGNRCVTRYKKLNVQQQIIDAIPTVPQVVKTGGITLVATTAALSTPILLKAVKPIIKQVVNKVKKALGKKIKRPNLSERRTTFYREKRGLPPLKEKK